MIIIWECGTKDLDALTKRLGAELAAASGEGHVVDEPAGGSIAAQDETIASYWGAASLYKSWRASKWPQAPATILS